MSVATALAHAHEENVLHCGLNPANTLVTAIVAKWPFSEVALGGFGSVWLVKDADALQVAAAVNGTFF